MKECDELTHQAQQQAVDHFLGKEKEEQLQKAMETLAKYKKKYSSVQGIEELARKRRNPLKDKPFIERLVPGIALQIHRKASWMVDFNLYSGYRFSPRFTAGAGWNQRKPMTRTIMNLNRTCEYTVHAPMVNSPLERALAQGWKWNT